ncbi:MAG: CsgG/HfaB family protein [Elusimicrobiota bacterium]|nr:CsgG/HfaB family protein [Elusimicrobiota bacterium]
MRIVIRLFSAIAAAALCQALLCAEARAGELDVRMVKVVKTFTRSAAETGLSTATLAVMPFKTDKKLAEKRVDYACGEILTNKFVVTHTFKVVERAQLDTVLKEQALGAGGVTESATAAKLGKLLGARLVIIGSVSRLGDSYHLSTEMVDAESGEILASDVTEVETATFDEDAGRYLVLVPNTQAIGMYLAGFSAPVRMSVPAPFTAPGGKVVTPLKSSMNLLGIGGGVRYSPWTSWTMDLMILAHLEISPDAAAFSVNSTEPRALTAWRADGPSARFTVNKTFALSRKFSLFTGAGATMFSLNNKNTTDSGSNDFDYDDGTLKIKMDQMKGSEITPTVRVGLEWRPKERFGISLFGNYDLSPKTIKETATVLWTGHQETVTMRKITFPRFYPDASMSLYF